MIPRVLSAADWRVIESGVIQRVTALNLLLDDLYHEQKLLKDGIVPADLLLGNANYRPLMQGIDLPHKTYVNVCGIDIVRDDRRPLPGAGGQRADPVRRQLRDREPQPDAADFS